MTEQAQRRATLRRRLRASVDAAVSEFAAAPRCESHGVALRPDGTCWACADGLPVEPLDPTP